MVDDCDFDFLNQWKWTVHKNKYAKRAEERNRKHRTFFMHREILNVDLGIQVDHIDRNGLNNQRSNLRLDTQAQNCHNMGIPRHNVSGFKGVCWDASRLKWMAFLKLNRRFKNLGRFQDVVDAAKKYDECSVKFFGEYAVTNKSLGLYV